MPEGADNPFFHRGPIRRREYFCGRAQPVAQGLGLLRNGQNLALVGQRRIGKTSFLFHVADPAIFETHGLRQGEHLFIYDDWEAEWRRRFVAEAGAHLEYYWRCLSDDERYTLAALPLVGGDEARRETLHTLERACLTRRQGQAWVYLCPPLEEFVRQQSVPRLLQLGPFFLDLAQQAALCDGAPLPVTRTEFKALAYLIRCAGQIVTPAELEKALWDDAYVEDPERVRAVAWAGSSSWSLAPAAGGARTRPRPTCPPWNVACGKAA